MGAVHVTNQTTEVTPEPILRVAQGFMASKFLYAANELGLFERLPATLDQVATRCAIPRRTARIVLDALVAIGLLERQGDDYKNGPAAAAFLAGKGPLDLRAFLRFWNRLSYQGFAMLEDSVRTGKPQEHVQSDDNQEIFSKGVAVFTLGAATALAEIYDFSRHKKVLDLGGGTGTFLDTILTRYSALQGTLFDSAEVATIARKQLAKSKAASRIEVVAGDFMKDSIPEGHDAIIIANIVHYFSPENNTKIMRSLRAGVAGGARALLVDFWTDPTHTEPMPAALMAGEFLLNCPEGDVYSRPDAAGWFAKSGWREVDFKPLAGPQTLLIAEAV